MDKTETRVEDGARRGGEDRGINIVEVKTKSQIILPFSEITTQNNGNK